MEPGTAYRLKKSSAIGSSHEQVSVLEWVRLQTLVALLW